MDSHILKLYYGYFNKREILKCVNDQRDAQFL